MKTKEFIRRLSMFAGTYGMRVSQSDDYNYITLETDDSLKLEVLCVETKAYFSVNSIEIAFDELPHLAKQEVMNDIIFPYISTPLEEREEEKKYVYRMNCAVVAQEYLKATKKGVVRFEGDRDFSTKELYFKSKFTDAEVENYPKEVRELFKICEKIEVTSND